jgi:hypothetical protein
MLSFLSKVAKLATMATVGDSAAKAGGLLSQLENGQALLALVEALHVSGVTDGLSCSLQSSTATVYRSMEAPSPCSTRYSTAVQHDISRANCFPRKILPNSARPFVKFRGSPRQY